MDMCIPGRTLQDCSRWKSREIFHEFDISVWQSPSQPSPTSTDACTTSKQGAMRAAFLTCPRLDRHCAAVCLQHESKCGVAKFSISQSKISQMHNSAAWHFNINLLAVLPLLRPEGRCGDRKRESLSVICDSPSANVSPKLSTTAEILR